MDCGIAKVSTPNINQNGLKNCQNSLDWDNQQIKKFESLIRDAAEAHLANLHSSAANIYKQALELLDHIKDEEIKSKKYIIKYMLCQTYIISDKLEELIEAYHILKNLEISIADKLPAIYYALGQVHYKFYRFDFAKEAIDKGISHLTNNINFKEEYIPGTNFVIKETTKEGLLDALLDLREKTAGWHRPDAICSMKDCQNFTQPYLKPCRDIFLGDPAFNGMVIISCNHSTNSCEIKFHQACWKAKKEELSPFTKISDKNILGFNCLTPNCEDNGKCCEIAKLKVIGEDGTTKTFIENNTNYNSSPAKNNISKGAVRKQINNAAKLLKSMKPLPKLNKRPALNVQNPQSPSRPKESSCDKREKLNWRLAKLTELRDRNFDIQPEQNWRPDKEMYDSDYMFNTAEHQLDPEFGNDDLGKKKSFVFSYYYSFIEINGPSKCQTILDQWKLVQNWTDVTSPELILDYCIDIFEFLLQSVKIVQIGEYICLPKSLPQAYNLVKDDTCECSKILMKTDLEEVEETEAVVEDFMNEIMSCEKPTDKRNGFVKNPPEIIEDENDYDDQSDDELDFNFYTALTNGDNENKEATADDLHTNRISATVTNNLINIEHDAEDYYAGDFVLSSEEYLRQLPKNSNTKNGFDLENSSSNGVSATFELLDDLNDDYVMDFDSHFQIISQEKTKSKEPDVQMEVDSKPIHHIHINRNIACDRNSRMDVQEVRSDLDNLFYELKRSKNVEHFVKSIDKFNKDELKGVIAKLLEDQALAERRLQEKESELKVVQNNIGLCHDLLPAITQFQQRYEDVKNDLAQKNTLMTSFIEEKEKLSTEFLNQMAEKESVIRAYEEEYNKLVAKLHQMQATHSEYDEHLETLQNALDKQKQTKKMHVLKILELQYQANVNVLNGRQDFCHLALEIIKNVNSGIETVTGRVFINPHDWERVLYSVQNIFSEQQERYLQLSEKLKNGEDIGEINLVLPEAPVLPKISLGEQVRVAFNTFYVHHMRVLGFQRPPIPMVPHPSSIYGSPAYTTYYGAQYPPHMAMHPVLHKLPPLVNPNFQNPGIMPSLMKKNKYEDDVKSNGSGHNGSVSDVDHYEKFSEKSSYGSVQSLCNISEKSEHSENEAKHNCLKKSQAMEVMLTKMREKYIGVPDIDLVESIEEVRKAHNNSLTGLEISVIIDEADIFVEKLQIKRNGNMFGINNVYANHFESNKQESSTKNKALKFVETDFTTDHGTWVRNNSISSTSLGSLIKQELQMKKKVLMSNKTWETIRNNVDSWKKEHEESECIICMESMNCAAGSNVYSLRCKHTFHTECLRTWFRQNQSCPNCRVFSTLDDEFPPLPSS